MILRRRILDYGLAGLLLLLPALVLWSNLKSPDELSRFDQAVLRISAPLQSAVSWVIGGIGGVWNGYLFLVDVEDENQELRADNLRLRRELAEARRLSSDFEVLEALVGLKNQTSAETLGARVVASSVNRHFRVERIAIDRGEDELEVGMPVIDADGLVGRVHRVYGDHADVLLVADPQSSIDVIIPRTGGRGVLTGLARDDAYRCEIEYLERGTEVEEGDLVVTSGLGDSFPANLVIGRIAAVDSARYGLYQKVEVEPAVDFSSLRRLLVLLAPPPTPDPDGDAEPRSRQAHAVRPF